MSKYYDMSSNKGDYYEPDPFDDISEEQEALNNVFAAIRSKDKQEIDKRLAELKCFDKENKGNNASPGTKRIVNGKGITADNGDKLGYKFADK